MGKIHDFRQTYSFAEFSEIRQNKGILGQNEHILGIFRHNLDYFILDLSNFRGKLQEYY